MVRTFAGWALMFTATLAAAQATPAGLWKTIDDKTKAERAQIRITESNGVLSGRIEKLFDASKADATCDKCTDDRKDKPVMGMTILRNMKHNAEDKEVWDGGDILDPNNGKIYKARLKPVEGGKKLQMRGYIGPFFRTQEWVRVE